MSPFLLLMLVHWYQQCVTVHHVPKCMSCHKTIVVITGRAHCFHDCIFIYRYICKIENWICTMTRHYAESSINILLTWNLPTESGVRQWSHSLMNHCIVCRLDWTIERVINLNVTWIGFALFSFRSFTCMVQLLFHSLLETVG